MEAFFAKPCKPRQRDTRPRFPNYKQVTPVQDGVAKLADAPGQTRALERFGQIPEPSHPRSWSQQNAPAVANHEQPVLERHRGRLCALRRNFVLRTLPMRLAVLGDGARCTQRIARLTYDRA